MIGCIKTTLKNILKIGPNDGNIRSRMFARVVEWHTRTTQNRVPQGLWVQVPPRAPETKTTSNNVVLVSD